MIVDKAVKMAQMMDIPVLGIVENMSYFKCPDCGNVHYIYGKSHVDEKAAEHGIDTVAKLPMDTGSRKGRCRLCRGLGRIRAVSHCTEN